MSNPYLDNLEDKYEQGKTEGLSIMYDEAHGVNVLSPEYLDYLTDLQKDMTPEEKQYFNIGISSWRVAE